MISGTVNAHREAIVRVTLLNTDSQSREFDAIVDTGFTGSLTLPADIIAALGLTFRNRGSAILANGMAESCDVYTGVIVWDGRPRPILVEAAETDPLLGMQMSGYRIVVENVNGGMVAIERIEKSR